MSRPSGPATICIIFRFNGLPENHGETECQAEEFNLAAGGSIWLPRGIPQVWANTATTKGKLILMCQPGGFEKFFDGMANAPINKKSPNTMKEVMAKYGMAKLGPPIFASSWMQQH